jgi:hypothetical protein
MKNLWGKSYVSITAQSHMLQLNFPNYAKQKLKRSQNFLALTFNV